MLKRDLRSDKQAGTVAADKQLPIFPASFSPAVLCVTSLCFTSLKKGVAFYMAWNRHLMIAGPEDPLDLNLLLTLNDRNILLVEHAPAKHQSQPVSHDLQGLVCSETFFPNMPEVNVPPARPCFIESVKTLLGKRAAAELQTRTHDPPKHWMKNFQMTFLSPV